MSIYLNTRFDGAKWRSLSSSTWKIVLGTTIAISVNLVFQFPCVGEENIIWSISNAPINHRLSGSSWIRSIIFQYRTYWRNFLVTPNHLIFLLLSHSPLILYVNYSSTYMNFVFIKLPIVKIIYEYGSLERPQPSSQYPK